MGFRYAIMPSAVEDMQGIACYIHDATGDWSRADAVLATFYEAFDRVCQYPLWHPVYPFPDGMQPRHEYRSVNFDTYKVFFRVDEERELVVIHTVHYSPRTSPQSSSIPLGTGTNGIIVRP